MTTAPSTAPTKRQLHILRHALGLKQGNAFSYRNYFVASEGSADYRHCCTLVDAGLMCRDHGAKVLDGSRDCFVVTEAGRVIATKGTP